MEAAVFQYHKEDDTVDVESFQGEKQKLIQPASLKDPKFEKLKEALVCWINSTLKPDHIVVQSLEEDLYDGLVLHHLLSRLAGVHLSVEDMALTSPAQIRKLGVILEELDKRLSLQDSSQIKWNVKLIHNKDLLATTHLLVAMVRSFQPELGLPPNVKVEVIVLEVSRGGIKSDEQTEVLTEERDAGSDSLNKIEMEDPIDQLMKLDGHKVNMVKKAILHFVNQNMSTMGLEVADMDKQFADGVILLLLLGQLEGFFIPLYDFHLTPVSPSEMLHNVTLALDLLKDAGLQVASVDPQDIVSQDNIATLKVLYALFKKHKGK
ncbi:gamma-parvin isoform X1 [Etheostoma cragini]|uniref:gamma-parvin isoform X1 n=1 Tax=Etheostoma cragini TaxID=417921 RepID=UPI00155E50C6|nr:gamma-parvin isoform X1 [Etheostoma cragini]XP_034735367.1 gamma-parvin isoform X1 [Etheostoma cragini]XP_034735368.1 gamma-parvin isoform X1 [Etheostoma cragini]XP_034735370.1 gamma-parvin isoform X1 [Etheostoma cragini]